MFKCLYVSMFKCLNVYKYERSDETLRTSKAVQQDEVDRAE